jgi:hypothetical protein
MLKTPTSPSATNPFTRYYYTLSVYDSHDLDLGTTTINGPFVSAKERQSDLNSCGYNGEEYQIQVTLFEAESVKQTSQLWLTVDGEWEDHESRETVGKIVEDEEDDECYA